MFWGSEQRQVDQPNTNDSVLFFFFFYLGFTPCKAEQPLQGMVLQEKETQKY